MRVLVACEHSGIVRDAFAQLGHDAWSCDILPTMQPGNHIQADVLTVLNDGWDLMIAHPPCTYLTYAGMAHWHKPGRAQLREEAMTFFMQMVHAPIEHICVENPRGLPNQAYKKPDQVIHPWMFGDPEMKRTCLWLKNLPGLWWSDKSWFWEQTSVDKPEPTTIDRSGKKRYFVDSKVRDPYERSRTFPSVAAAMAIQWTEWVENKKPQRLPVEAHAQARL